MQTRRPVNAAVAEIALIFGQHEALPQKIGNFVQGNLVMQVPSVLIGNGQRPQAAVNDLNLAQPAGLQVQ